MGEAFTPGAATLTARVFANPHARIPPTLFYDIAFPVRVSLPVPIGRPLFSSDEPVTDVQLEFIDLGPVEWRALPGREFRFPSGPDEEYPDGGVYLGGTHHSVFLTRLQFAELRGESLAATLDIDFDLSLLRPLPEGLEREFSVRWQLPLAVDPAAMDAVMAEARQGLGWGSKCAEPGAAADRRGMSAFPDV
ncbi:MAG: hypothetical protein C0501_31580 [Isosphaera sp.]|nr:hypothetical protein [Isosphaera sp.]